MVHTPTKTTTSHGLISACLTPMETDTIITTLLLHALATQPSPPQLPLAVTTSLPAGVTT